MTTGEFMGGVLGMYAVIALAVMFVVAFADMLRRHDLYYPSDRIGPMGPRV